MRISGRDEAGGGSARGRKTEKGHQCPSKPAPPCSAARTRDVDVPLIEESTLLLQEIKVLEEQAKGVSREKVAERGAKSRKRTSSYAFERHSFKEAISKLLHAFFSPYTRQ